MAVNAPTLLGPITHHGSNDAWIKLEGEIITRERVYARVLGRVA
jgi:hypothetical protein